ncbi:flavin reductase family protein [Candidatus Woesearchaeota archaeon]|nr:flavin reductase family protein [Candidatus Woesearchaeota archaeon]
MIQDTIGARQLVLVTTRAEADIMGKVAEKDEISATSFHCPVSIEPFIYAVCLKKLDHAVELIKKSKVFCINFMPFSLAKETMKCALMVGKHADRFLVTNLSKEDSDKIDCPRINEAIATLDCEMMDQLELGERVVFIGKVVFYKEKQKAKRIFHIKGDEVVGI